jgi:hypothetical protein
MSFNVDKLTQSFASLSIPDKKPVKKRVSTEYNGMELVVSILIMNLDIHNATDLIEKINDNKVYLNIKFNTINCQTKYIDDILKKVKILPDYINNIYKSTMFQSLLLNLNNIVCVYISGKKNTHSEINILNINLDKKSAKADIYIKYQNNQIIGISIKQSVNCTKTNFSVHKYFPKNTDKNLTIIKKDYLKNQGYSRSNKIDRSEINSLFYPNNKCNPYWIQLKEAININKNKIANELANALFCVNIPYDIYEFNGINFSKLNNNNTISNIIFEEHLPYYLTKNGTERCAAKLFYRLIINNQIFRIEIRWKGNVYNSSPQFQIHADDAT